MWDQDEFEKHWRNEFPDCDAPKMDLNSVEDVEEELERCKARLKVLQRELSMEKFKVIYLQTTMARHRGEEQQDGGEKLKRRMDVKAEGTEKGVVLGKHPEEPARRRHGNDGTDSGHVVVSARSPWTGRRLPTVPRKHPYLYVQKVAARGRTQSDKAESEQDTSDHEYEDVELNENFVLGNLVTPRAESRRDMVRTIRLSKDFDSSDDGRLSPASIPVACGSSRGSGRSTPERRSDGYLSSDHEDSSSAGELFIPVILQEEALQPINNFNKLC